MLNLLLQVQVATETIFKIMKKSIKNIFLYFISVLSISCRQISTENSSKSEDSAITNINAIAEQNASANTDTASEQSTTPYVEQNPDSLIKAQTSTFYLVQVASGHNYDSLLKISSQAASILGSKVDLMQRIYKKKRGIVLRDKCDDETYCGEYFPRRPFDDQNFVSIEMQYAFEEESEEPKKWVDTDTFQMIILANILESKISADSVVRVLQSKIRTAKTIKKDLFLGCMH